MHPPKQPPFILVSQDNLREIVRLCQSAQDAESIKLAAAILQLLTVHKKV